MLNRSKHTALKHCANYDKGKCLGAMFSIKQTRKGGYIYPIYHYLDGKKSGKDCNPDGCKYFNNFVVTGITSE
jgi:hypothetical protein